MNNQKINAIALDIKSKSSTLKTINIILFTTLFLLMSMFFNLGAQAKENEIATIDSTDFLTLVTEEKGKVILVNFFASWCPPCQEEVIDLNKVRKEYGTDEVYIIGLSLDEDVKALEKFLVDTPLNYPVYRSELDLALAFNISSIPHNVIYDKELKPVYSMPGIVDEKFLTTVFDAELAK